jgi:hypothetical protein
VEFIGQLYGIEREVKDMGKGTANTR